MPFDGNHLAGSLTMSEHSWTFPTSALNMVLNEDEYSEAQSITLMEISPWELSRGQLHPKPSPMVMSTWRNRSVLRVCPAIPSESTEFSAFSLVSFGRKGKKRLKKKKENRKNILTTWFLDLKRINANQFRPWHLLFYILKPITYSVY